MVEVMDRVANATLQSSYDSIFASILVYDGSNTKEFWSWLHHIESECFYTNRNPQLNTIMSIPQNYLSSMVIQALVRKFSKFTLPVHAAAALDDIKQEEGEPIKLYVQYMQSFIKW